MSYINICESLEKSKQLCLTESMVRVPAEFHLHFQNLRHSHSSPIKAQKKVLLYMIQKLVTEHKLQDLHIDTLNPTK